MSLNDEITQAIQKNLPAAVAGELKLYLAQAEKDKEAIEALKNKVSKLEEQNKNGQRAYDELEGKYKTLADLKLRDDSISERERNLEVTLANHKVNAAEGRANVIQSLVETIFKNPVTRRSIQKVDHVTSNYNQAGQYVPTKIGETVTEEEKEE